MYEEIHAIKYMFTTRKVTMKDGSEVELKKLHVRTFHIGEPVESFDGFSIAECNALEQKLTDSQKMTENELEEYAKTVCVEEYLIQFDKMVDDGDKRKNHIKVKMSQRGEAHTTF